jgi:hypothetical protein
MVPRRRARLSPEAHRFRLNRRASQMAGQRRPAHRCQGQDWCWVCACAGEMLGTQVFMRELLPQDLIEIDRLYKRQAIKAGRFLSHVVGTRAAVEPCGTAPMAPRIPAGAIQVPRCSVLVVAERRRFSRHARDRLSRPLSPRRKCGRRTRTAAGLAARVR